MKCIYCGSNSDMVCVEENTEDDYEEWECERCDRRFRITKIW